MLHWTVIGVFFKDEKEPHTVLGIIGNTNPIQIPSCQIPCPCMEFNKSLKFWLLELVLIYFSSCSLSQRYILVNIFLLNSMMNDIKLKFYNFFFYSLVLLYSMPLKWVLKSWMDTKHMLLCISQIKGSISFEVSITREHRHPR